MIESQLEGLRRCFAQYEGTITAFSGGVDSALALYLSRLFLGKQRTIGVISNSESLKTKDYELAQSFAKENDIILKTIHTEELADDNYSSNPINRCYYCKSHLYRELQVVQSEYPGYTVINGTNADDHGDYRPGLKAADERKVESPLAAEKITKKDVRALAKYFDLEVWDKPASPCLSSRIPYGSAVTREKLKQIEAAESILNRFGFSDVRVRHFGDLCKIEVPAPHLDALWQQADEILPKIRLLGFASCVIDQEGLVSGKLNRGLQNV